MEKKDVIDTSKFIPVVFKSTCMHCQKQFLDESLIVSVGHPYEMLIHYECAPFFNYRGWPHSKSRQYYIK